MKKMCPVFSLIMLLVWGLVGCSGTLSIEPTAPKPTREDDQIIPTLTSAPLPTDAPTPLPTVESTLIPLDESAQAVINTSDFQRFGVSGNLDDAIAAYEAGVWFRHLFAWTHVIESGLPEEVNFWQMIRVGDSYYPWNWDYLNEIIEANPGAYWMVGNEPDVPWQDNVTPQQYAAQYHEAYTTIKTADPTAQIVAGSITQGTPLRLQWLDELLIAYQEMYSTTMPVDVWSVHAYVLREEKDSWGVGIPPGLDVDTGELYEIEDHDDLDLFIDNLLNFRRWMAANGYDVPMAVTEFGILLPNDYGFPPDLVAEYMADTFDLLLETTDASGYSADNNRIAQFWFWYMIEDTGTYPTGNLFDSTTSEPTNLGEAWIEYLTTVPEVSGE